MANCRSNMLSSTSPVMQKPATSVTSTGRYSTAYRRLHQQQYDANQEQESLPPQPQPQPQTPAHTAGHSQESNASHLDPETEQEQEAATEMIPGRISKLDSLPSSTMSSKDRRPSILLHFRPKDSDIQPRQDKASTIPTPPRSGADMDVTNTGQHENNDLDSGPQEGRLIVRLDLRKLGTALGDVRRTKKPSQRRHTKHMAAESTPKNGMDSSTVQTTLSASSWSAAKPAPKSPAASDPAPESGTKPLHLYHTAESSSVDITDGHDPASTSPSVTAINGHSTPEKLSVPEYSVSLESDSCAADGAQSDVQAIDCNDYVINGPKAMKRQSAARVLRDHVSRKRSKTPDQGATKRKKLDQETKGLQQGLPTVNKEPTQKQVPKTRTKGVAPYSDVVSITGDELALKYNNDYCEACLGLGEFICCDSCPKAFHFSCCQPPVDPNDLPDEWDCNECRAAKNPPAPSAPGIFKDLLDNANRSNPRAFVLPPEVQSFFAGVTANSDGEYEEISDQKPKSKRKNTTPLPSGLSRAEERALQLEDAQGNIRLCYRCDKSAVGATAKKEKGRGSYSSRVRESKAEARLNQQARAAAEQSAWRFNLLVAAVMANDQGPDSTRSVDHSGDQDQVQDQGHSNRESIQDAVLDRLTDPAERQEYMRFRAFQRYLREHGAEEAMKQWLGQQQIEKERIASEGLLNL
ncbi:hypothetical protein BGZ54_003188 [Gamsiella multidivaricata]|nr:hypothetical protein BGZ54_003188 [Gamsiella multidivaricata]